MATSTNITSARIRPGEGLPFALVAAEPIPGLARRPAAADRSTDGIDQARAMNAVLVQLNAILAEGGQHA